MNLDNRIVPIKVADCHIAYPVENKTQLDDLRDDIHTYGFLHPIIVMKINYATYLKWQDRNKSILDLPEWMPHEEFYFTFCGNNRLRIAHEEGHKVIKAIIAKDAKEAAELCDYYRQRFHFIV